MAKYKKSYLILFGIIALIIGKSVIRIIYSELHPNKEKKVIQRVYNGEYKGRLKEKYPSYFKDMEIARDEINKSIKSHKTYRNPEKINYIITDYFDEKGRLVFTSEEYEEVQQRVENIGKSKDFYYQKYTPSEKGFIYDKDGKVVKKIIGYGGMPYKAKTKDSKVTFLKNYYTGVSVIKVKYLEDGVREEEDEGMGVITQNYEKIIRRYKGDILLSEKTIFDSESDDGFIIATVEKKYNEKGELIYKTVERKDKTNDYKSFTEMDFAKDEIVTKYYKGKDVFATVTENLVGPVETIEEIEMVKGQEVKKVYKNKVKAIVKRQKVGEPVKIVDIQTYDSKKLKKNVERYIFDNNGNLKYIVQGTPFNMLSYIKSDAKNYPYSMEDGYLHESFYSANIEKDNFYKYFYNSKNLKKIDIKVNDIEFFEANEEEDTNISFGIIDITKFKLIKKEQLKEKTKTLEELLNGYKYE